jgi:flavin reductase (DIM6/NTAB) family NADH-FMN oxidoreductase RutF
MLNPTGPERGVAGSADALRQVMARFISGVTIVTADYDGTPHAMTATAVSSVSLDPPLILVCVSRASRFHQAITMADSWCVSILAGDQEHLARHFSNRGRDLLSQFDGVPHSIAEVSGAPILDGVLAWLDCTTYARYDGGDHTIVVGRVERASADETGSDVPLTYYQGSYS